MIIVMTLLALVGEPIEQPAPPEQAAIRAYLNRTAFDPESVQIREITPAQRMTWGGSLLWPKRTEVISCVTWNAKNRYGGYVGFQTDAFVLNATATEVVDVWDNGFALRSAPNTQLCQSK